MRSRTSALLSLSLAALALTTLHGCELLNEAVNNAEPPTLAHQDTVLTRAPTTNQLVRYLCPSVVGSAGCSLAGVGSAPAREEMRFDFDILFEVGNPNSIDIPTLSMLLALNLYPGDGDLNLGAVCVTFCEPGDATCSASGAVDACASDQEEIDSWEDFAQNATDNLVDILSGEQALDNTSIRRIPANGSATVKVSFTIGIDPMLEILERAAADYINAYIRGNAGDTVDIPYEVQGTLWFDLPYGFGRFGLGFGPVGSIWSI